MINKRKTIGLFFLKATIFLLLFSNLSISKALDAKTVCSWMNNQAGTSSSKLSASEAGKSASGGAEALGNAASSANAGSAFSDNNLDGKIAVVTEERLAPPDNKFTFNCWRQTVCSFKEKTIENSKTNIDLITFRECLPTYTASCTPTATENGKSTAESMAKWNQEQKPYTLCEPVQVLISDAGTDMLYHYIGLIYTYAAGLGALLSVLFIIVAGIQVATAGDEANALGKAKDMILKNVIGLAILFLSAVILYIINPNFFVL